jgi:hypothetical protein
MLGALALCLTSCYIMGTGAHAAWHRVRTAGPPHGAAMIDIPDNVDLKWIARHLVDFRDETRSRLASMEVRIGALEDDVFVQTALLQRLDHKLDRLARRVDAVERQPETDP